MTHKRTQCSKKARIIYKGRALCNICYYTEHEKDTVKLEKYFERGSWKDKYYEENAMKEYIDKDDLIKLVCEHLRDLNKITFVSKETIKQTVKRFTYKSNLHMDFEEYNVLYQQIRDKLEDMKR